MTYLDVLKSENTSVPALAAGSQKGFQDLQY